MTHQSPEEIAKQIAISISAGSKTGVSKARKDVAAQTIYSIINLLLPEEKEEYDVIQVNFLTNEPTTVKKELTVHNDQKKLRDILILIAQELKKEI